LTQTVLYVEQDVKFYSLTHYLHDSTLTLNSELYNSHNSPMC